MSVISVLKFWKHSLSRRYLGIVQIWDHCMMCRYKAQVIAISSEPPIAHKPYKVRFLCYDCCDKYFKSDPHWRIIDNPTEFVRDQWNNPERDGKERPKGKVTDEVIFDAGQWRMKQ